MEGLSEPTREELQEYKTQKGKIKGSKGKKPSTQKTIS